MKFVIASEKNIPTQATSRMLEDLWKTNSTLDRYAGNIAEKADGLKGNALGAAIDPFVVPGSYYGGKYGAQLGSKLATPENISSLLRGLGTLQKEPLTSNVNIVPRNNSMIFKSVFTILNI